MFTPHDCVSRGSCGTKDLRRQVRTPPAQVLCLCDEEWGDDELAVLAAGLTPAAAPKLEQVHACACQY